MSTRSRSSANPPGTPSTTVVAPSESPAAFKFWISQSVGNFSGDRFRAWLYSFKDYCDTFNLLSAAHLKEVGSKLCDDARIWHQDMLFDTWEDSSLQPFIVKFQEYTNKVLVQQTKGFSGADHKLIINNFHSLANPSTLEEAYNLVCENYVIYVEREQDEEAKATSKWNSFIGEAKKKETLSMEALETKIKKMRNRFKAIYLAHERSARSTNYRHMDTAPFSGICYNCNEQGQKSERCTAPCSICKGTDHSNYACPHCICNNAQRPIAVMMAEQFYQTEKRPLSTPEGEFLLNKKTNSGYIIDNDFFKFCSPLIKPRNIRSQASFPDHNHTLLPLKCHEREDSPSPEKHPNLSQPISPEEYAVKHPSVANTSVIQSRWNPEHLNLFFPLEELLDFEDPIITESDTRYKIVTFESVPKSPTSKKHGDYTHVIDLEIAQTSTTMCKLDQPTCEHDDSMAINYDSMSSYQQTRENPTHQVDCRMEETVYKNSHIDLSYANIPKEIISKPTIDNNYLNTSMNVFILGSPKIFINTPMDEFNTPMKWRVTINNITETKT
ncbi:hypothetical protein DSO57_1001244 [Entomophthora muscae]|uniref:Uncharacterized protein n=1 Tax=Entomophthora muscae TaxID=34485 RepID=A0ACC2SLQ1_9FUNG|nr:hypothetical protein DSO57_1001244 [Entomophthora muscae]